MKKWLLMEALILAVVLLAAVGICIALPAFSGHTLQPPAQMQADTGQTTQTTTQATTEPAPTWMTLPEDRALTAQKAFVYDCETDTFPFLLGEPDERIYPASITKLFTAYVALQFLTPDRLIQAGDVLDLVGAGSSVAGIEKGDVLSVQMLVEAMLLPSGNDAAYILADAAGKAIKGTDNMTGSAAVAAFLKEMNRQAKEMGMTGTNFVNPDGYHRNNHYTTFADMAILAEAVLENETIMNYASESHAEVTFENGVTKQWKNTNYLVDPTSEFYCPIATGLKTGQTPSAGSCLLSAFATDGRSLVIGVFGCPEIPDRFADTLQLLNKTLGTGE